MARFKFSTRSSLRIFYRTNVNQPSVTQLQDVYDITNSPYITAGNPDLKPQYNHLMNTRYTFTNTSKGIIFVGNVLVQAANNYITNATYVPHEDSTVSAGIVIPRGGQLTKPVNLNGYFNMRSFLTFATPISFIKSNLNFNGGVSYSKLPGILNSASSESKTITYSFGAVIGSNISQYVDFTVSYTGNYNDVRVASVQNDVPSNTRTNYFQQTASVSLNLLSKKGWFYQTDAANQFLSSYQNQPSQVYTIWNMSAGKKILKDQKGELKFTVFDLLKQNQAYTRTVNSTYIQDLYSQVLQRYFMLTFTYNLRNFGTAAARSMNNNNRGNLGGGEGRPFPPGGY
jgi:hypothetical protein